MRFAFRQRFWTMKHADETGFSFRQRLCAAKHADRMSFSLRQRSPALRRTDRMGFSFCQRLWVPKHADRLGFAFCQRLLTPERADEMGFAFHQRPPLPQHQHKKMPPSHKERGHPFSNQLRERSSSSRGHQNRRSWWAQEREPWRRGIQQGWEPERAPGSGSRAQEQRTHERQSRWAWRV